MKYQPLKKVSAHLFGLLIGGSITLPLYVSAAPGTLADSPLFLTNKSEPNIFFMTDDSGSMDWEITTDESSGVMVPAGNWWSWVYVFDETDNQYNNWFYTIPSDDNVADQAEGVWRARTHLYNKMYYNPKTNYKVWPGVDDAGVAYKEGFVSPSTWNTRIDPYLSASNTRDLSVNITQQAANSNNAWLTDTFYPARYWVWDDSIAAGSDNDGIVDQNDSHTLIEIKSATPVCSNGVNATVTEQRTGSCMLRSYNDEMKNFANWFTYYRRREYAAKNAMANVVKNSNNVRMGVATINSNQGAASEEPMASMNTDVTTGNKRQLLNNIYSIHSASGTPLRSNLQFVGNYYAGSGTTPFGNGASALDTTIPTGATTSAAQCSQNFTILMTDGFYNGNDANNPAVNNADGDDSSWTGTYDPDNDGTFTTQTFSFDEDPYQAAASDTLADVAMYYYERDLRPTIANKVPLRCGQDENPGQHMVTYTVAFGVNGTGTVDPNNLPAHPKRGYATNCTATTGSSYNWPVPNTDPARIDDMIHAAYNGRGEYLNASNPEELSTSLTTALRSITSRIGAASGVTFNTNVLNSNSKLYRARFNSTQWSGELEAIGLDAYGNLATSVDWEAGNVLSTRDLSTDERIIVTYKPSTNAAVAFRWANLDASQLTDLKTDSVGVAETTSGFPVAKARLDFIRGDRNCEIGASGTCAITKEFRSRSSRLADLIHSQPIYAGVPSQRWPEEAPFGIAPENFSDYKSGIAAASAAFSSGKTANTRTEMIYIGGNDGMLHAFNATNGEEVYGYIPSMVYSSATGGGLHTLTEPSYNHKYYVDLSPTISEAYINTGSGDNWHTTLVAGLRGGGRGLFALNITDPDAVINAASTTAKETAVINQLMWEFTNSDDADLGYSFSQPSIVPLGTSSSVEWYVVFGNGYNADTGAGANGESQLFLLKLEGPGTDNVWDLGTDYFKISTKAGDTTTINGLSTPVLLDLNGDSIADRAYAGDLLGYLWAFDLTGSSGWSVAYKQGTTPKPLFSASTGDAGAGSKQPITEKPVVTRHPSVPIVTGGSGNEPNLMIYFGTGQYLTAADLGDTTQQSFYAIWDKGDKERTVNRSTPTDASNHLVKKIFTNPDPLTRTGGTEAVDYTNSSVYGWYYDLPDTGERVTTNPAIRGDIVFFNTLIPSLEPCGFGGSGWELGLSTTDGSSSCGTFDTNGDGALDCIDDISSAGSKKIGSVPMESNFIGGGGGGNTTAVAPPLPSGCPAYVEPALQTCPAGQTLVTTYPVTSGCPVKTNTCKPICPSGKTPVTRWTTNSDGSQTKSTVCVDDNASHTGRFSWRELPF